MVERHPPGGGAGAGGMVVTETRQWLPGAANPGGRECEAFAEAPAERSRLGGERGEELDQAAGDGVGVFAEDAVDRVGC